MEIGKDEIRRRVKRALDDLADLWNFLAFLPKRHSLIEPFR